MSVHETTDDLISAPSTPKGLVPVLWIRTVVLLAIGCVIAFTAPQHEDPRFSLIVIALSLFAIGCVTLGEFVAVRAERAAWLVLMRAVVAFVAGAGLLLQYTQAVAEIGDLPVVASAEAATSSAVLLAAWAALTGGLTMARWGARAQAKNVAVPSAGLSFLLAISVLLFSDDFVAIIGFFGAYVIVRAVFLGISVFDMKRPAPTPAGAVAA